jgi:O-antigen ligase
MAKLPKADPGAWIAAAALAGILLATAFLVDPAAESSFDAPKRLAALAGTAIAAAATFGFPGARRSSPGGGFRNAATGARRLALFALLGAAALAVLSALASPRRAVALDSLRSTLLLLLLLPVGASRVLESKRAALLAIFLAAAGVNAAVSILQSRGLYSPFEIETVGSREATGAFVGNVGYLALLLGFTAVACLALAMTARKRVVTFLSAGGALLSGAGLLVNQNLTAISAFAAGAAALVAGARLKGRALLTVAAAVGLVAAGVLVYRPVRERVATAAAALKSGNWDRTLSYRFGPWGAALEMARSRPLLGFGPGTFGAEFVPHRLRLEARAGRRFVNPLLTSSYAEAHNDYLQPFAELGVPAGLMVLTAAGALLAGLVARLRRAKNGRAEALLLLALLVAGATSALTWFPMQRPITGVPLLLAAGRAWRISGERPEETE